MLKQLSMPWDALFNPGQRLFWLYLLSSAILSLLIFAFSARKELSFTSIKDYWLNPEALLDYRYFFISWFIKIYLIAPLLLSAKTVALWVFYLIQPYLPPVGESLSYESTTLIYTASLFVVSDFSRYWLHRWLHSSDILWQFHKIHHSPQRLNPLTFYRVHPIESFLFGLRYALSAGLVTGICMCLFGARINLVTVLGANLFIFIFSLFGSHLRHSAIEFSYGRWLEHVFISPSQHQMHHAAKLMRFNYGGYLALWDWLFGTLKLRKKIEKIENIGLGQEENKKQHYNTVIQCLYLPFVHLFEHWQKKRRKK